MNPINAMMCGTRHSIFLPRKMAWTKCGGLSISRLPSRFSLDHQTCCGTATPLGVIGPLLSRPVCPGVTNDPAYRLGPDPLPLFTELRFLGLALAVTGWRSK